jgi:hypothetical protein
MLRKTAPAASKLLAEFGSYSPETQKAALDHFGKSIEEIEVVLDKCSPDDDLRDDLAMALWEYARGKAHQDGSLPELPSQVSRYIKLLDTTAQRLRDVMVKLVTDDAALLGERVRVEEAQEGKSYEEANWAKLSPTFRRAHNRLRQQRGLSPIPDPEIDLWVPSAACKVDKVDPVNRGAVAGNDDAAAHTVAVTLAAAGIDARKVLDQLEAILSVTKKADEIIKSEGGRPPDVEYGLLMDRVIGIFRLATGRRATLTTDRTSRHTSRQATKSRFSGVFFRLAELVDGAAASATQQPPKTNNALGELLKRLLEHLKG